MEFGDDVGKMFQSVSEQIGQHQDQMQMAMEADHLATRRLLESLTDDQMQTLMKMLQTFSAHPLGSIMAAEVLGMCHSLRWRRNPLENLPKG